MTNISDLNDFPTLLQNIETGALHKDLNDELVKVMKELASVSMAQPGAHKAALTLALDFSFEDGMVIVNPKINSKTPKLSRRKSMFFLSAEGEICRQDPRQHSFGEEFAPVRSINK